MEKSQQTETSTRGTQGGEVTPGENQNMKKDDGTKKVDPEQSTRKRFSTSERAVRTAKRFKETIIEEEEGVDEEPGEDMDQDREVTNNEILAEIKKLQKKVNKRADEQDVRIEDMQSEIDELRQEIAELRSEIDQVHLETRKHNLIFCGVPEDRVETPEKTFHKVNEIIDRELGLVPDVDTVKRLRNSAGKLPRKILVTFRTARAVERILENKHKLRGARMERVYINKDLPPRLEKFKNDMRRETKERDDYYGKYDEVRKSSPAKKERRGPWSGNDSGRSSMIRDSTPAKNLEQGAWSGHENGRRSMIRDSTPAKITWNGAWGRSNNDRKSMTRENDVNTNTEDGSWVKYDNGRRGTSRERTPVTGRSAGRKRYGEY